MKNINKVSEKLNSEIDVPIRSIDPEGIENINETTVPPRKASNLEEEIEYADRMDRHVYKKHGLNLLIGCLVAYGILVLFDTVLPAIGLAKISSLASGFIELLKFIVSTLIGFVFSENLKNGKEK